MHMLTNYFRCFKITINPSTPFYQDKNSPKLKTVQFLIWLKLRTLIYLHLYCSWSLKRKFCFSFSDALWKKVSDNHTGSAFTHQYYICRVSVVINARKKFQHKIYHILILKSALNKLKLPSWANQWKEARYENLIHSSCALYLVSLFGQPLPPSPLQKKIKIK